MELWACWVSVNISLLFSEQQMPWKDAVTGQTILTMLSQQTNFVPPLKFNVCVATGCDVTVLPGGEWVQNPLSVTQQIQTGSDLVDGTVERELINPWMLTGKIPCVYIIAVLSIVDDLMEGDGLVSFGEVVA